MCGTGHPQDIQSKINIEGKLWWAGIEEMQIKELVPGIIHQGIDPGHIATRYIGLYHAAFLKLNL